MESPFGELLRYYRERCTDPEIRRGRLTQARLGELLGYTSAAISEWERGKSKIDADDRHVFIKLISVLHNCGGLQTLTEANTFLGAGNYRALDDNERRQIFPEEHIDQPPPTIKPDNIKSGSPWQLIKIHLEEHSSRLIEKFQALWTKSAEGPPPRWPRLLIALWGWPAEGWTSERALQAVAWLGIWLLTWTFTFPMLHWPFANRLQAEEVILHYMASAFALPLFAGLLTRTKDDEFWRQQRLATAPGLRFFTHIGAILGFHLSYATLFAGALVGYYLGLGQVPPVLEALAALWPILVAYASARQIPFNQWRAYGALRFTDGSIWLTAMLFPLVWGGFFWVYYEWLLLRSVGVPLLLSAIALGAGLSAWQKRRTGSSVIPAHVWILVLGVGVVLSQAEKEDLFTTTVLASVITTMALLMAYERIQQTLVGMFGLLIVALVLSWVLKTNIWVGRALTLIILPVWWRLGKKFIWFPLSFWGVLLTAGAMGWLISRQGWSNLQGALVLGAVTLAILGLEWYARQRRIAASKQKQTETLKPKPPL